MRELGLTLIYRCFIMLRFVAWRVLRPRAIGVRVVVRRGDEFLLVHHRGGAAPWGLPGGAIDRGEAPADAARREVLEESGCPVTITGLHGVFHYLVPRYIRFCAFWPGMVSCATWENIHISN